ncbi:MAG: c-type cytochrome [Candidatus Acidiferrales bacterium]
MRTRPIVVGTLAATSLVIIGCKARSPGPRERAATRWIKQNVTVGGKKDVNPLPPTQETIREGQIAFSHYCISCHGLDGQNTGVPFADQVSPPVPMLASPEVQGYTDGQLRSVIANGIFPSGMPASKELLSDEEIWSIVTYIRHLPPKGSLGDPGVYSDEEVDRLKQKK